MKTPQGKYIDINGEKFYEIRNYDAMQPFFISIASDTDLWMYLSSTGGLSCGRRSPDFALFPYYTDDKITQNYMFTGSRTLVRVNDEPEDNPFGLSADDLASLGVESKQPIVWEPFGINNDALFKIERRICKSVTGNKIVFFEFNYTLGLMFGYSWQPADSFGWVRKAFIRNVADRAVSIEIIDGVQNVLPSGVNRQTQNVYSTLVDGYKKTEQVRVESQKSKVESHLSSLVLFRMEAIMVDKAEPSESLRCNTVYSIDADDFAILTSSMQLDAFRHGGTITAEPESKGVQGAYLLHKAMSLEADESREWFIVMDVEKDASDVHAMLHEIAEPHHKQVVLEALQATTANLRAIVAHNDGMQSTGDEAQDARHFANVLFNTMRGGYYADDYTIHSADFAHHVEVFNHALYEQYKSFFGSLPEQLKRDDLENRIIDCMDHQLHRLFMEYLPLTFSRRHGDPSRPWNNFDIRVKDKDGHPLIAYQGNWRDIFQNWEALSASYPNYVNAIIAKFLNASTADGYNPYRITSEGIDWEVINPDDPWSNIGYWGDHQIIYLCKLLELSRDHDPKALQELLSMREFTFANVPYRIKSYEEIVATPKDTIRFDQKTHEAILARLTDYGQDARLILDKNDQPLLVTGAEKLLITMLVKLSNHIPTAGIWMNTLRPEWNDANNALVGNGASVVTACYLYRYMKLLEQLFTEAGDTTFAVHAEVLKLFHDLLKAILDNTKREGESLLFDTKDLRTYVDAIGHAGEAYRNAVYAGIGDAQAELPAEAIVKTINMLGLFVEQTIRTNRREDGLYHAYNLVKIDEDDIEVTELYEMLEGQVAVLSSGLLSAQEAADLLDAMRQSALYREDQQSYMLYPNRRRPSFLEMNNLPAEAAQLPVVQKYIGSVIKQDCDGGLHFDASYRNANNVPDELKDLYEQVFNHHAFTGRSGTFYKYEGLGSIYWHMVSKLLLAVGENIRAISQNWLMNGAPDPSRERLIEHYWAIKEGLGLHKSPEQYGSFPFDAYSHTPAMSGVQQPGMTGQVKEDILSRWFELGIEVHDGAIHINPLMLREQDFLDGKLSFTYCGTRFVYHMSESDENTLIPQSIAKHIFARDGQVKQIDVYIKL